MGLHIAPAEYMAASKYCIMEMRLLELHNSVLRWPNATDAATARPQIPSRFSEDPIITAEDRLLSVGDDVGDRHPLGEVEWMDQREGFLIRDLGERLIEVLR